MAGFDPNILREEEQRSGFDPGEDGDDTFHLESLPAYPTASADASADEAQEAETEEESEETAEEGVDSEESSEADATEVEAIEELDDDGDFASPMSMEDALKLAADDEAEPEAAAEEEASAEGEASAEEEPAAAAEEETSAEEEPAAAAEESLAAEESAGEEAEDVVAEVESLPEVESFAQDESETAHTEAVALGEELRTILTEDLEKSKERRSQQATESSVDGSDAVIDKSELEDDAELPDRPGAEAIEVDLSEVTAQQHPSQVDPELMESDGNGEAETGAGAKKKSKAELGRSDGKRERKIVPLWLPLAAACVLIVAAAILLWRVFLVEEDAIDVAHDPATVDSLAALVDAAENADAREGQAASGHEEQQHLDGPGDEADPSSKPEAADGPSAADAQAAAGAEDSSALASETSPALHDDEADGQTSTQQASVDQPPPRDPVSETSSQESRTTAALAAEQTSPNSAEKAAPPPADKPILAAAALSKQQIKVTQRKPAPAVRGEFVVQIHSSPSLEDAEEWLQRLQAKNVRNAFITTHYIRDQIWYRVRFGIFATQAEAEQQASALGFTKSWVVRVR